MNEYTLKLSVLVNELIVNILWQICPLDAFAVSLCRFLSVTAKSWQYLLKVIVIVFFLCIWFCCCSSKNKRTKCIGQIMQINEKALLIFTPACCLYWVGFMERGTAAVSLSSTPPLSFSHSCWARLESSGVNKTWPDTRRWTACVKSTSRILTLH